MTAANPPVLEKAGKDAPNAPTSAAPNAALKTKLGQAAATLGLALQDAQLDAMLAYCEMLTKWNKVYNLTAVRDPADMLTHHLIDSLAVVGPLMRQLAAAVYERDGADDGQAGPLFHLLDVGSGAGLPGVVIAICCPEVQVDCVDTVAKKTAFINQIAITLKLPNLRAIHERVESLAGHSASGRSGDLYDVVCSRAFASLADFTRLSAAVLKDDGVWLAMKAKNPTDELSALEPTIKVFHVEQLQVPGLDAERRIVWMRKAG